ncbi:hypothetical protein MBM_01226 [Drepanopeziza brunnea f. sp. 'multigermtubi' MB_m1]|uniref:Small secreted protein n=1 Tax=Marssonina brunnea f. sp. multigermtubi (strain MB_m1) TaxID=1072389 RepID=K1Y5R5_MARBU|nr:uncharacterized protein MBM_01226 [Drepanopeziza brunnea f. sp. 'multigermtubi' MB_m1]EKD20544.1 hypothetical protein MBM_01226 [Drepanopeziza brunnea f. sp. 'multigermtubi' MB_m1]
MQFTNSIVAFGLFALVASSLIPKKNADATPTSSAPRSAATPATSKGSSKDPKGSKALNPPPSPSNPLKTRTADVLKPSAYNDFQISSGTAGSAEANAAALFTGLPSDLTQVTANDLEVIKGIYNAAEDAEVNAFNPAIAAATGPAADALEVGKNANKVLKLTAQVIGIQVEASQGGTGGDFAAVQAKLAKSIAADKASAGQASTAVSFDATS